MDGIQNGIQMVPAMVSGGRFPDFSARESAQRRGGAGEEAKCGHNS